EAQDTGRGAGTPQPLTDAPRALCHEPTDPLPDSTTAQGPDRPDPFAARVAQQGRVGGHSALGRGGAVAQAASVSSALASDCAGTLALAISTSCAKAATSCTASSASMRRSTSISAPFRPWLNRL